MYGSPMYSQMQGTGAQFNPGRVNNIGPVKRSNILTAAEQQKLAKKENQFSLALTETERLRGICNHRRLDAMGDTLTEDMETGLCMCTTCGYEFMPLDAATTSKEQIQEYVNNIVDVLQTIKLIYIDMPTDAAREFFQIIPLLEKVPQLFEYAVKSYAKHEGMNPYGYNTRNMGAANLFNMLVGAIDGGSRYMDPAMNNQGTVYGNPNPYGYYGAPNGAPVNGYQMPTGQYGSYNNPQSNGFGYMGAGEPAPMPGYGAPPMGGYQSQTSGFAYDPNAVQQQPPQETSAGGQQPVKQTEVTNGATTEVTASFKA